MGGGTHTHTHTHKQSNITSMTLPGLGAGPSKKPQSQLKSIKQYLVKTEYLTKDFI